MPAIKWIKSEGWGKQNSYKHWWLQTTEKHWNKVRSSHRRCSVRKDVFTNFAKFTEKHLAYMFSCEFCKISNNTFFTEHLWVTVYGETSTLNRIRYWKNTFPSFTKLFVISFSVFPARKINDSYNFLLVLIQWYISSIAQVMSQN